MAKNNLLTPEEAEKLFSELDASGVVASDRPASDRARFARAAPAPRRWTRFRATTRPARMSARPSRAPRSPASCSCSCSSSARQVAYGVVRRLNTANLSERVDIETVSHAMESGVEWGDGFTQFPGEFVVDEADERAGVLEVSVTDVTSKNELELLSNSQIQASALSTNALLNEHIDRVVYNVFVLVDDAGNFAHDRFFGFVKAKGTRRAMLTFVWTKDDSSVSNYIDWQLRIIGMDDETTAKIQEQVNGCRRLPPRLALRRARSRTTAMNSAASSCCTEPNFRGGPAEKVPKEFDREGEVTPGAAAWRACASCCPALA